MNRTQVTPKIMSQEEVLKINNSRKCETCRTNYRKKGSRIFLCQMCYDTWKPNEMSWKEFNDELQKETQQLQQLKKEKQLKFTKRAKYQVGAHGINTLTQMGYKTGKNKQSKFRNSSKVKTLTQMGYTATMIKNQRKKKFQKNINSKKITQYFFKKKK